MTIGGIIGSTRGQAMKDGNWARRHFEHVSGVINALTGVTPEQRRVIAYDFARSFEKLNTRFDRAMFVDACLKGDMRREKINQAAPPLEVVMPGTMTRLDGGS